MLTAPRLVFLLLSASLFIGAFIFPFGLYPLQDFVRDFAVYCSALILIVGLLYWSDIKIAYTPSLMFLPLFGLAVLVSHYASPPSKDFSFNWFVLSIVFGALVIILSASFIGNFGRERSVILFAKIILALSVVSCVIAIFRFYGVLGALFKIVEVDGDRLIGPLGQPNLMAIFIALGVASLLFLWIKVQILTSPCFFGILAFLVFCGTLTASRSWYLSIFICVTPYVVVAVKEIRKTFLEGELASSRTRFRIFNVLLVILCVSYLAPILDEVISKPLIENGFVNRSSAAETLEKKSFVGSSGRIEEWRKIIDPAIKLNDFWVGLGAGQYSKFSNTMVLDGTHESTGKIWNHSHNLAINFFVEFGYLGLLVLFSFFVYLAFILFRKQDFIGLTFAKSVLMIFLFHNMVEFSFWHLPFLALFLCFLVLTEKIRYFEFSEIVVRKALAVLILIIGLPLATYVGKDAYNVIRVMYKDSPGINDQILLQDVTRSSLVGDSAMSVMIMRFAPPTVGVERAVREIEEFSEWRPSPLYKLRESVMYAGLGSQKKACDSLESTIYLYPDTIPVIQDELKYLATRLDFDVSPYMLCVLNAVAAKAE